MLSTKTAPKRNRLRNCEFKNVKAPLDTVTILTEHGEETVTIPALPRTYYWAILSYMYQNTNRLVPVAEYCEGVAEIMEEVDGVKWDRFRDKDHIKTVRHVETQEGVEPVVVEQDANDWKTRLISNGRNLCRIGGRYPTGRRLIDMGHVLRYVTGDEGEGYFILYTKLTAENTTPAKRGRRPERKQPSAAR